GSAPPPRAPGALPTARRATARRAALAPADLCGPWRQEERASQARPPHARRANPAAPGVWRFREPMSNRNSHRLPLSELTCGRSRPPGQGRHGGTQYLISFRAQAVDHIPGEDMPAVAKAAHAVVQEAINAGVLVCTGGLEDQRASIVTADGTVTGGPYPEAIGGLAVIEVPSREEALEWAVK